jgi:hypothetical protein
MTTPELLGNGYFSIYLHEDSSGDAAVFQDVSGLGKEPGQGKAPFGEGADAVNVPCTFDVSTKGNQMRIKVAEVAAVAGNAGFGGGAVPNLGERHCHSGLQIESFWSTDAPERSTMLLINKLIASNFESRFAGCGGRERVVLRRCPSKLGQQYESPPFRQN